MVTTSIGNLWNFRDFLNRDLYNRKKDLVVYRIFVFGRNGFLLLHQNKKILYKTEYLQFL